MNLENDIIRFVEQSVWNSVWSAVNGVVRVDIRQLFNNKMNEYEFKRKD
jgi:hypothetical protein